MKQKIGVGIHNRFDFEVRDSITGELKQTATAYNIVLDSMWKKLVDGAGFFSYIFVGTGTGTLSPARTSLFNHAYSGNASLVERVVALPTAYVKKKIVIAPEQLVGSVLTEVGVAPSSTSSTLVTHALLKDSEGNPISITKTATDVITVYATIFSTISAGAGLDVIGIVDGSSELLRYLTDATTTLSAMTFTLGASNAPSAPQLTSTMSSQITATSLSFTAKDYATRKATSPLVRLGTTSGNGHIREIAYGSVARLVLPNDAICPAVPYVGVPLGTGDGVTTKYKIPSRNLKDGTLVLKKNGAIMVEGVDFTKGLVRDINYTNRCIGTNLNNRKGSLKRVPNTNYFVGFGVSGYVVYGEYLSGVLYEKGCLVNVGAGEGDYDDRTWDMSPIDGLLLYGVSVSYGAPSSPYVRAYSMLTGTPVLREDLIFDVPLLSNPACVAWSPDGQHVAFVMNGGQVRMYKRNGNSFTKLPTVGPTLSFDYYFGNTMYVGDYLFVGTYAANPNKLVIFKRTGDTYTECVPVGTPLANIPYSAIISDDGATALIGSDESTIVRYSIADGVFTREPDIVVGASFGSCRYLLRLSDGVALLHLTAPSISLYDWDGAGTLTEVASGTIATVGSPCFLADDNTILQGGSASGASVAFSIDISPTTTQGTFAVAPAVGDLITADYSVNGIHKTDQYVLDLQISVQYGEGV